MQGAQGSQGEKRAGAKHGKTKDFPAFQAQDFSTPLTAALTVLADG